MKRVLVLLAAAGIASATSITFTNNDSGVLLLASSAFVAQPGGTTYAVGANGNVGGLCAGDYTHCPDAPYFGSPSMDVLTFTLSSPAALTIMLQDKYVVGDVYQVMLSTGSTGSNVFDVFTSTAVTFAGTTPQPCYNPALTNGIDASSANSCLDVTTGVLAAGSYSITVWDIVLSYINDPNGDPFDNGDPKHVLTAADQMSPASFSMDLQLLQAAAVPEPATFGMLGLGAILLGLSRRIRARM